LQVKLPARLLEAKPDKGWETKCLLAYPQGWQAVWDSELISLEISPILGIPKKEKPEGV